MRNQTILVDINKETCKILKYKQYDNNNILQIIVEENYKKINLNGYVGFAFFELPSGLIIKKECEIKDNVITIIIDNNILSENGKVLLDLTLSDGEDTFTLFRINLVVEETIDRDEAIIIEAGWDIVAEIVKFDKAEEQRVTNEEQRVDYESVRIANESDRQNEEMKRIANENVRVDAEEQRINNEAIRQSNETKRQSNESTRMSRFNEMEAIVAEWDGKMQTFEEEYTAEMQQLFQSVSNGKSLIASAITDRGINTASDATFATMADNINLLTSTGGFIDDTESNNIFMYGFRENTYTLKFEDNSGVLDSFDNVGIINAKTLSNNKTIYENKDLINYNIAPYSATKIGVYDTSNTKVGEIPLEGFKPNYGERLYRFGLLADVHNNGGEGSGSENQYAESREDLERALKFFNDKESVWATCIAGDLTDTGAEDQLQIYKTNVDTNSPNTPVYVCAGNHDCRSNVSDEIWEQYTGNKRCFEITKGTDHFIFFGMSKESMGSSGSPYTQENIDWLKNTLDKYRNERCFIFMHLFFPDRSGNLKRLYREQNWLGGNQLVQIQALSDHYRNTVWFSGHSHWKWSSQMYEQKANVWKSDTSGWCVHVPSCAVPKFIANANAGTTVDPLASEGAIVDVYDNYIDIRAMDLKNGKYLPIGHYRLDTTLVSVLSTHTIDDVMDELFWIGAYISSSTGQLGTDSGYATTCYIPYDSDKIYTLKIIDGVAATRVFYYDSNKVFISCTAQLATGEHKLTMPSDTAYIRVRTRCNGVAVDDVYNYVTLTLSDIPQAPEEVLKYTNLVPTSIDSDGSIYNNIGYKNDSYVSTDGTVKDNTGTVATGYIKTNSNIFYIFGAEFALNTYSRLKLYDENFNTSSTQITANDTDRYETEDMGNGITKLTFNIGNSHEYIRFTLYGTGENLYVYTMNNEDEETPEFDFNDAYDELHWFNAYIDSSTGELATDSNASNIYATTAFISYDANKIYKLDLPDTVNQTRIFYYDSNKSFISCTASLTTLTHTIDSVPDGTAYLRFRTRTNTEVSDYDTFIANINCTITQRPTYNVTNIVPTLQSVDSTAPYDGIGYRNNAYISSSTQVEGTYNGFVLTGLIPINVTTANASIIYVRGVTIDTSNTYTRLTIYDSSKVVQKTHLGTGVENYYAVEELGEQYYKLSPAYAESTGNTRLSGYGTGTLYVRFSFTGVGENLVMTLDQPIE